jgi:hypothetical protein
MSAMSVLLIIFIVLKLVGWIAISWWWVFSPIWIPLALVGTFIAMYLIFDFFKRLR